MSNVTSLASYRAKKGLAPARVPDDRPLVERVLTRYQQFDAFHGTQARPAARFRALSNACAKRIVRLVEGAGMQIDESARFQFFGTGRAGAETLEVRLNRVERGDGQATSLSFLMTPDTLEPVPVAKVPRLDEVFKPLLTLPMTLLYRLQ